MITKLIIPNELKFVLSIQKDKRVIKRILKVYNALLYKKGNQKGYFSVPSKYLESINNRYYKTIDLLLEYGIIDFKKSTDYVYKDNNIFESIKVDRKTYNVEKGICMKYKFLINISEGETIDFEINVDDLYKNKRWFNITKKSLIELGLQPRISRDNFSRRLHTNITGTLGLRIEDDGIINSYKDYCKGFYSIDSITSQPRLLWNLLNDINLFDSNLNNIFENDLDFYDYLIENIEAVYDRDVAKNCFGEWINGKGYMSEGFDTIKGLFPIATMFIKNYKSDNYKSVCRLLQYTEGKIWVDDLLENLPVEFGLTVHDSLIVKKEDVDVVYNYCVEKYPNIKFKKEII